MNVDACYTEEKKPIVAVTLEGCDITSDMPGDTDQVRNVLSLTHAIFH